MLNAAAKSKEADDDEDVYNLGAASVADLSTWLQVSATASIRRMGQQSSIMLLQ